MDYIQATDEVLTGLDELEHYGVKDMSWYKHKFGKWQEQAKYARGRSAPQADGAEVVLKDSREKVVDAKEKARRKARSKKMLAAKKAKAEARAKLEAQKKEWIKDPKQLQEHLFDFTDEEIQSAMARFKWDEDLARVKNDRLNRGKKTVDTYLGYADTAIKSYNTIARVVNAVASVGKDDDEYFQMPYIPEADRSKQIQNIRGARAAAANLAKTQAETNRTRAETVNLKKSPGITWNKYYGDDKGQSQSQSKQTSKTEQPKKSTAKKSTSTKSKSSSKNINVELTIKNMPDMLIKDLPALPPHEEPKTKKKKKK